MAARFPLSVSSFAGSINGARTVVSSLALRASAGVSGGVLADGVSLHPVRIKRLRNSSSVRLYNQWQRNKKQSPSSPHSFDES